MDLHYAYYSSPIGLIEISGNGEGIATLYFVDEKREASTKIHPTLKECHLQLEEYFKGLRKEFGLKLNPRGTDFQKRVWEKLAALPYGKTVTYLDISRLLGDANATRAVGNANGSNPISIIVPCHRVIGVNGKLTGYGGGLWRKEWLLNHEMGSVVGTQAKMFA
ncbi:MAG TPA: methylated-DNA--[protein]-cysteine S-methyltransferase [Bacteroidia bacterium]|jgi:methylated-DNA-[protein]-cysteine S-methyltransferase